MIKKKINYLVITVVFMLAVSCSVKKLAKEGVYKELPPKEYEAIIKKGNVNIIDVRTKSEFKKSHLKGAINASYFSGKFSKLVEAYHLDNKKVTLIYCETQHRSPGAAKKMHKLGFTHIIDLKKGMSKWRKKGFSFESEK